MIILRQKGFTRWDDTDELKRAKDSDILAEKKKENASHAPVFRAALGGAALGLGAMGAAKFYGGFKGAKGQGFGNRLVAGGQNIGKKSLITGAALGACIAAISAGAKRAKKQKDVDFYNDRLEYAQRQAERRERKDWKTNMTMREGYSY